MDQENTNIIKRLEWMDAERRKDRNLIADLEAKVAEMQGKLPLLEQQGNETSGEMSRLITLMSRFDQMDGTIAQMRVDYTRSIEAVEKQRSEHDREMEKVRRADMETINKSFGDLRKNIEAIADLRKGIQSQNEESLRLNKLIEEIRKNSVENRRDDEEYHRTQRILEEGRRQDAKRITDLQGEVAALRKRGEEQRGKVDLASESVRKLELRIGEVQASETERKTAVQSFIEKQNLAQVDRDRIWKDWGDRFTEINQKSAILDSQIQNLETANRTIKRSQEAFDDITQRFERRVNEITEMQRLTEERFRQEWVNFKSDDQKRWTNYTLTQDEQHRETARIADKQNQRLLALEDASQELRDLVQSMNEELQGRLEGLLTLAHDWLGGFERRYGSSRQQGSH